MISSTSLTSSQISSSPSSVRKDAQREEEGDDYDEDEFDETQQPLSPSELNNTSFLSSPNKLDTKKSSDSTSAFSNELLRIQELQTVYLQKIEKERIRKDELDEQYEEVQIKLKLIQDKTKNGKLIQENARINQKLIHRLEYQLQTSNNRLSVARRKTLANKLNIDNFRKDKLLHLQILSDLEEDIANTIRKTKQVEKDISMIQDRKTKLDKIMQNTKQRMINDIRSFSDEIHRTKQIIHQTQSTMINTIRENLQLNMSSIFSSSSKSESATTPLKSSSGSFKSSRSPRSPRSLRKLQVSIDLSPIASPYSPKGIQQTPLKTPLHQPHQPLRQELDESSTSLSSPFQSSLAPPATVEEVENLLKQTEFTTTIELLQGVDSYEDLVFRLYDDTQSKYEQIEVMEVENKAIESQLHEQLKQLQNLEKNHYRLKKELEDEIERLNQQIQQYYSSYHENEAILSGIAPSLLSLLQNVAMEDEALDHTFLSTGITDRNLPDFLGIVEQRIDQLIQMSRAANHQPLKSDDFVYAMRTKETTTTKTTTNNTTTNNATTTTVLPSNNQTRDHRVGSIIGSSAYHSPSLSSFSTNTESTKHLIAPSFLPTMQEDDDLEDYSTNNNNNNIAANQMITDEDVEFAGNANNKAIGKKLTSNTIQPINILLLKDIMNKKIQKMSFLPSVMIHTRHLEGINPTANNGGISPKITTTTSMNPQLIGDSSLNIGLAANGSNVSSNDSK